MPRPLLLLLPLALLPGCALEPLAGPALVAGGASLVLTGRTPVDHAASWYTGRDCSAVRLELRQSWCAPPPEPPAPPPFCTRARGGIDCWTEPPPGAGRGVASPPR